MKHRYQSFTRIGRQFQSLERQVYADWTSVSFPFCQRSCLIWRIMTNTLTNTMTNTYVVIFLSVSIFGRGYHSRYQNFEFTGVTTWHVEDSEIDFEKKIQLTVGLLKEDYKNRKRTNISPTIARNIAVRTVNQTWHTFPVQIAPVL